VALAACGGEPDPPTPSEPPATLLAKAAANPAQSGVATVQLDLGLEGDSPLAGASSISLHGPFALDRGGGLPRFDFGLDAQVAGFGVDGSVVSTGDDAFVVFFGENYRVGRERVAAIRPPRLRIADWIEDPRYAGADDVTGTQTERIEGTLNSSAIARDLGAIASALGTPGLAPSLAGGVGPGSASAWVAFEDDTIRRVSARFPITVPPDRRAAARGISGGTVSLDAQISSVGAGQEIAAPPGGGFKPIERLLDRISSLGGLAP
jgi:hypothetical protein